MLIFNHFYFDIDFVPIEYKNYVKKIQDVRNINQITKNITHVKMHIVLKIDCPSFDNIIHLELGELFNNPIQKLPSNLQYLKLGREFNQKIDNFPETLKYLEFGYEFDQPLKNLPQNLETLILGYCFDNMCILPKNLKTFRYLNNNFVFREYPNYLVTLPVHLPNNLKILQICGDFEKDFNTRITLPNFPDSLTHITFGKNVNEKIDKLPSQLIYLKFGERYNQLLPDLPDTLEILIFGDLFNKYIKKLSPNLRHLEFGRYFNKILNLPTKLETLILGERYCIWLKKLPESLKRLKFGNNYNQPYPDLHEGLEYLKLDGTFYNKVKFPNSLIHLEFGEKFNEELKSLPINLEFLKFNKNYNKKLPLLPDNLKRLEYGKPSNFPDSLKLLKINYMEIKNWKKLPKRLEHLEVYDYEGQFPEIPIDIDLLYLKLEHSGDEIRFLPPVPKSIVKFNITKHKIPKRLKKLMR